MRTIWRASVRLGRLAIPVGLAPARADGEVAFRTLHRECGQPIRQAKVCVEHGELTAEELVKGYEVAPGQFVQLEDAELAAIAPDASERAIRIGGFVDAGELDPLLRDRAYFLAPAEEAFGRRPYVLLGESMRETRSVAVGRFVAWGRENLCAIAPRVAEDLARPVLVLWTLHAAGDVHSAEEIATAIAGVELDDQELDLGRELVMRLFGPLAPDDLRSGYRDRVLALVEAKLVGGELVPEPAAPEQQALPLTDLATALKLSLRETPRRRRSKTATRPAAARA